MKIISLALMIMSLSSCYSYKIFPVEYRSFTSIDKPKKAFVLNPNLKKEYSVLSSSGIYEITNDSTNEFKIKLYPMIRSMSCGNPLIASWITLGQLPIYLPDYVKFEFDEIQNDKIKMRSYNLKIARRVWFWDLFNFNKDFKGKAGKALLADYYSPENNKLGTN